MSIEYIAAEGEVPPAVPDGPRTCDAREMRILHNAFLWGYDQIPELVRSGAGNLERSEFVGGWIADLDATLHVHHEGEDLHLWEKLEQRAPACALHVSQMRAHHVAVAEMLDDVGPLLEQWRRTADVALGEELIIRYQAMLDVLKVHLRREVVEIVPVTEKVVTEAEWKRLGEHASTAIPKSRLLPQLGLLFANSSIEDRERFLQVLPPMVRLMWRTVGRRKYTKQFRELFPGRPVPETI